MGAGFLTPFPRAHEYIMKHPIADNINKELKTFGEREGNNLFRLVWSDDQFEHRKGTFNEFHGSLFLRTVTGIQRMPKYPFIKERWILEVFSGKVLNTDVQDHNGYEAIYVFEGANKQYLPPRLNVCKIVIHTVMNPSMNYDQRKEYFQNLETKEMERDVEYFKDIMEDNNPYLVGMLRAGEAVINPGLPKKGD